MQALNCKATWSNTHPSLSDRLQTLNQPAAVYHDKSPCAGEILLGVYWQSLLHQYNQQWCSEKQANWFANYAYYQCVAKPLIEADSETLRQWNQEQQLERARALQKLNPSQALIELDQLHTIFPSDKHIQFARGVSLLASKDMLGVEVLESVARQNVQFRIAAFSYLYQDSIKRGAIDQAQQYVNWLKSLLGNYYENISTSIQIQNLHLLSASNLVQGKKDLLSMVLNKNDYIYQAFLYEGLGSLKFASDKPAVEIKFHLLNLVLDAEQFTSTLLDEDAVQYLYENYLNDLIPANEISVVKTFFNTEYPTEYVKHQTALIQKKAT